MRRTITRHLTYNKSIGRYVKRINGELKYFGEPGGTEKQAYAVLDVFIRAYEAQVEQYASNAVTIGHLFDAYDIDAEARVKAGSLQLDTLKEYRRAIGIFLDETGRNTLTLNLRPAHFRSVRQRWSHLGPLALARYIRAVRTMFQWGIDNAMLQSHPLYGREFDVPDKSAMRAARESSERDRGERKFDAADLARLLNHPLCDGWLRACVLLGLNAGLYAKDCADLVWGNIRTINGVPCLDRTRAKTRVRQTAPLWPETLALIETMRRPGFDNDMPVFRTPEGNRLIDRNTRRDYLAKKFKELRTYSGVSKPGIGFGSLRHTHVSAVGDVGDDNAARRVRGHEISDISGHYDKIPVERLKRVTDLARERLLLAVLNESAVKPPARARKKSR